MKVTAYLFLITTKIFFFSTSLKKNLNDINLYFDVEKIKLNFIEM